MRHVRTALLFLVQAPLAALLFLSPSLAAEKPVLTIYTYDAFAADWGPAPQLEKGFEKFCGCTVNFIAADSSIGALRKAQIEGEGTSADIILGLDTSLVGEAAATGLFAPHQVDTDALSLPVNWQSDLFVPFDYGFLAMIYDRENMPSPPRSFEQLASGDSDISIIVQDPRASTTGRGLVLWLKAAYGNDTREAWPDIAPHIVTLTRSWSEAYTLFLNGEADMVLSYTTSPAYHMIIEQTDRYAAAPFREGQYTQIEVAGILASSPHKELARKFLAWLISQPAQSILPTTNWMYPVLDIDLPAEFSRLITPEKALLLDDAEVTANADLWVNEMLMSLK